MTKSASILENLKINDINSKLLRKKQCVNIQKWAQENACHSPYNCHKLKLTPWG